MGPLPPTHMGIMFENGFKAYSKVCNKGERVYVDREINQAC